MSRTLKLLALLILTIGCAAAPPPLLVARADAATTAPAATNYTATLTWSAVAKYSNGTAIPSSVAVTYNVWQDVLAAGSTTCPAPSTGYTQVASALSQTSWTSAPSGSLVPGQVVCFAVTATAGGATGAFSNVGQGVVPTPPPTLVPGAPTISITVNIASS